MVVNIFHEVSVVHTQLAHSTLQSVTTLSPATQHLSLLVANMLTLVQLPKSSAKQLQVRYVCCVSHMGHSVSNQQAISGHLSDLIVFVVPVLTTHTNFLLRLYSTSAEGL